MGVLWHSWKFSTDRRNLSSDFSVLPTRSDLSLLNDLWICKKVWDRYDALPAPGLWASSAPGVHHFVLVKRKKYWGLRSHIFSPHVENTLPVWGISCSWLWSGWAIMVMKCLSWRVAGGLLWFFFFQYPEARKMEYNTVTLIWLANNELVRFYFITQPDEHLCSFPCYIYNTQSPDTAIPFVLSIPSSTAWDLFICQIHFNED